MACPVCRGQREVIYTPSDVFWPHSRYFQHLVCRTCRTREAWGSDPDASQHYHETYEEWPDFALYVQIEPARTVEGLLVSLRPRGSA